VFRLASFPDAWVVLKPQTAYARMLPQPSSAGWRTMLRRPLLTAFVVGCAIHGFRVQRPPEIHRLPYLDPLLEMRLLELHSNMVLQLIHVAQRIQAEDRDGAPVRPAHSFEALHRGCLPCAVRTDQPEDFAFADFKRNVGDGHCRPVGFADAGNFNDWTRRPGDAH